MDYALFQRQLTAFGFPCGAIDGAPGAKTWGAAFALAAGKVSDCSAQLGASATTAFPMYGCTTPARIAFALAEIVHETGEFALWEENLDYSAKGLAENWPSRYATNPKASAGARLPTAKAIALAKAGPEAIANDCYARPTEGNTEPGDGYRFRGRGCNMQTFRNNYAAAQAHTGIQFVDHPDLMAQPASSLVVACWFWRAGSCWARADAVDYAGWRKITNGGTIGLSDFTTRAQRLLAIFTKGA